MAGNPGSRSFCHLVFSGHRGSSQYCRRSASSAAHFIGGIWFCHPNPHHIVCTHIFKFHWSERLGSHRLPAGWYYVGFAASASTRSDHGQQPSPVSFVNYHWSVWIDCFIPWIDFSGRQINIRIWESKICPVNPGGNTSKIQNTVQCFDSEYGDRHHCPFIWQNLRDHYDICFWCPDALYFVNDFHVIA